jgi:hypothetical protein
MLRLRERIRTENRCGIRVWDRGGELPLPASSNDMIFLLCVKSFKAETLFRKSNSKGPRVDSVSVAVF